MAKKIKVGIAGLGRAGVNMHCGELAKFKDLFEIVAVCDVDPKRVDSIKEKYSCKGYTQLDNFFNDSDVELISIATRSPEHTTHAIMALEAGKYVFLEKPIALSYDDALKLKAADEKHPNKLFFRHNRRFEPAFQHIREILASGILGDVYEIKLRRHNYQRRTDWQTIIECGGGQLNNWGPHIVDHALRFLESPVKEVWSDLKRVVALGDAEDHLKIILKGANERVVDLEISGGVAIPEPEYIIHGSRGSLVCENGQDIKLEYLEPDVPLQKLAAIKESPSIDASFGNEEEELQWRRKTIMVEPATKCNTFVIWKHLYEAIREDIPFPITIDEAVEVVRIIDMAKKDTKFEMK
jgi:predicted dehydrogenase